MQAEPLKYIEKIGVPTTSIDEAGVHVSRYMNEMSADEYLAHIEALTDQRPMLATRKHYHITFAYLCQNMVKQQVKMGGVDPIICLGLALDIVKKHEQQHSFMFLEDDVPAESSRNMISGITRPQGWKREQAIQFMRDNPKATREQFVSYAVDKLEMTPAGSASYYYMAYEAVHGKKPPKAARGKKPVEGKVSRRDQAIELMKADPTISRSDFIKGCVEQLQMTEAGATTYYYQAYQAVHGTNPPKLPRGKAAHAK